jgi:hypothetical protein
MNGLESDEMALVGQLFQEANAFVYSTADEKMRNNIASFIGNRVMTDNTAAQMTPKGIAVLRDAVFNNAEVRDYIMKLCFIFFSRWAAGDDKMLGLARNLSRGLSQTPYISDNIAVSGVPGNINEHLSSREEVFNVLASNPWLLIVVLFPLFINGSAFDDPAGRSGTTA